MGPKPVYGERSTASPVSPAVPVGDHPLEPGALRRARARRSPGIDHNFELTSYTFDGPGHHELSWRVDDLVSNTLTVEVRAAENAGSRRVPAGTL